MPSCSWLYKLKGHLAQGVALRCMWILWLHLKVVSVVQLLVSLHALLVQHLFLDGVR